jgi:aminocarboxymuconate-semialdehyde decarboxylase
MSELKIDIHTHILPDTLPDLRERYGAGPWVRLDVQPCGKRAFMRRADGSVFREVEDSTWSLTRRLSDCDACGIDVHVMSTVPVMFSHWAAPEHALDLAVLLNDHMAASVATAPERLVGLGMLPMQSPELAVGELRRCMRMGLAGVQIGTNVRADPKRVPRLLSDKSFFQVFEAAAELGAAVFVHPWDMLGEEGMQKYWLPWLVGMPAETCQAMCSFMFSGVLERLPNLRVCFAHGGGSFPGTLARIQHGWDVRPDLCATDTGWSPTDHCARRRVWVDSLVHEPEALLAAVRVFGANRVCLGSDYPFPLGEFTAESRGTVYAGGALVDGMAAAGHAGWERGGAARRGVLSGAALEWLHMDEARFRRMRGGGGSGGPRGAAQGGGAEDAAPSPREA